jgi:hypothetical protein
MASRISGYVENKLSMQDRYIDTELMEVEESMTRTALKAERMAAELTGLSHLMAGVTKTPYEVPQTPGHRPVVTTLW